MYKIQEVVQVKGNDFTCLPPFSVPQQVAPKTFNGFVDVAVFLGFSFQKRRSGFWKSPVLNIKCFSEKSYLY